MKLTTCTIRDLMERVAECGDEYREVIMMAFVKRSGDSYTFDMDHPGWSEARAIRKRVTEKRVGCLPCQKGRARAASVANADWHKAINQQEPE